MTNPTVEATFIKGDTTYFNKEVKQYFINGLGALVVEFTDGTKFTFYNS